MVKLRSNLRNLRTPIVLGDLDQRAFEQIASVGGEFGGGGTRHEQVDAEQLFEFHHGLAEADSGDSERLSSAGEMQLLRHCRIPAQCLHIDVHGVEPMGRCTKRGTVASGPPIAG
jgi:hypothetical protein